jgi:hypothetical protein
MNGGAAANEPFDGGHQAALDQRLEAELQLQQQEHAILQQQLVSCLEPLLISCSMSCNLHGA